MPREKFTKEKQVEVLDNIYRFAALGRASAASKIDSWTLSRWRQMADEGRPELQDLEYRGVTQNFARHVEDAIEQSIDDVESLFRASARDGVMRPLIHLGAQCYQDCELAMSLSEAALIDMCDLGVCWPDKKKRVYNPETQIWERVPLMYWEPPSHERQLAVLRSWSERYADRRSITGNFQISGALGVSVVQPPPLPQLVEVIQPLLEAATADAGEDAERDAATDADFVEVEPEPEPTPSPDVERYGELTSEQKDTLNRLRATKPGVVYGARIV